MAAKRLKGLGRGLEALLGPTLEEPLAADPQGATDQLTTLSWHDLVPGQYQPRTRMDEGALYDLAESIKAQGIMQPVLVRPLSEETGRERWLAWCQSQGLSDVSRGTRPVYEIIAGERRFRAARLAGLERIPALVRVVPDEAAAAMALIENIQRENLNPLEEAWALQRLVQEFGFTHEQAAQSVGRSRSAASNLLRLLQLAPHVQTMLLAGDIEMGHARALLGLSGSAQVAAAHEVVARDWSVRDTEAWVKKQQQPALAPVTPSVSKSRDVLRVEEALADVLLAQVEVRVKKRVQRHGQTEEMGELAIQFGSLDELNGLIERLRGPGADR